MAPLNLRKLIRIWFCAALLLCLTAGPLAAGPPDRNTKNSPPQDLSKFVGAETCRSCHEEIYKKFEPTPHWKTTLNTKGGPAKQGCEACHGPGAAHVEGGGDKSKIVTFKGLSAKKVSDQCMACHQYGEEHSNFTRSMHRVNDVSCVDCHSVHAAKEKQFLLTSKQPDLCFSCHLDVKPEFSKPFRHRVMENLVKCTDCHNQHGGFLTRQLRATAAQDTLCFKCHVDKAGPFVFEHHPVKVEGCVACHSPHGSSNPRLLRRSQINLLCLECHTLSSEISGPGIPSFHNQSQKYQACTMCHTAVHGSNSSRVFFK